MERGGGSRNQVKIEFLSSRSVQNSNLTLETDEQKGEKRNDAGSSFHPLGKDFYVLCARVPGLAAAHERVRRRGRNRRK